MVNKQILLPFFICLAILTACHNPQDISSEKAIAKRIVIIGLDGISVDGYHTAKHPNLDQLMADGTLSLTTRNVMPSVTLPNWTTHLTGSGPEQHGVLSNGWTKDNIVLPAVDQDAEGYYPSIFKVLKDEIANAKTAFYYNWAQLINPINKKYLDEVSLEDDDEYLQNYAKAFQFIEQHKADPTLVFLYSVHTDHAGHNHGWMSPEYIQSIEEVDVHIGAFINKLKEAGLYEDTHFMFFTDHGGLPEKGHGGLSPQELEVPWAITGPGIVKGQLLQSPNNSINTATTIAHLFGCNNIPSSWIGSVPTPLFEAEQ